MQNAPAAGLLSSLTVEKPSFRGGDAATDPLSRLKEISRIVDHAVASWHSPGSMSERRGWHRTRYRQPAIITPFDDRTCEITGTHKIVSGRDISPSGFSFTHLDPLACRSAIVTFDFDHPENGAVFLRLNWCRFTRAEVYQSGGKFLRSIESPILAGTLLEELPYG